MDWPTNDVLQVVLYLLPGFVAAWVFHGLTAYARPSHFERLIHALILTAFVQPLAAVAKKVCLWIGAHAFSVGSWDDASNAVWLLAIALALGLAMSWCANNDTIHRLLRKYLVTKETSFPSEWYGRFRDFRGYVTLHLSGNRRLYGWPTEWPSDPHEGHFAISQPEWVVEAEGSPPELQPLTTVECLLVPVSEVSFVEFMDRNWHVPAAERSEQDGPQRTDASSSGSALP